MTYCLCDRQAQPTAARVSCAGSITTHKALEHDIKEFLRNAGACILKNYFVISVYASGAKKQSGAFAGITQRVFHQNNRGANIGNETIFSGTVGAAMTGVLLGFRAIALSQYFNNRHNIHWDTAEHASEIVLKYLIQGRWDYGTCFNVNLPDVEPDSIKDIAITRQGEGNLNNIGVIVREDLRAIPYAWLNLERSENAEPSDSEGSAVRAGHISVTPLHFDRTHYRDRLIHSH